MTQPGVTDPKQQAFSLHLAGASAEQISTALGIPIQDVKAAISDELAARQPGTTPDLAQELERVNALWRAIYTKAVSGDAEAGVLALRLAQHRADLNARAGTVRPPAVPPLEQPHVAVRTAWQVLAGNATHVAQVLVDIARYGSNEGSRVTAAIAVLDRVGISRVERSEVAVHLLDTSATAETGTQQAGALVRKRLAAIAARKATVIDAD